MASKIFIRLLSNTASQSLSTRLAARVSVPCLSIHRHRFSSLQASARPSDLQDSSAINSLGLYTAKRFKKRRKGKKDEDEIEEESDDEVEENPMLMDDDFGDSGDNDTVTIDVNSLRLDAVAKSGLQMTRQKVEEAFYKGDLYINGQKPGKKSETLSTNDEIDLVTGNDPEDPSKLMIKRMLIVNLPDKATQTGRMKIEIKRYPQLTVDAYADRVKSEP